MQKSFVKIENLPDLSTVNHLLEFTNILRTFYHLLTGLARSTHSLIYTSEYAKVGLNYNLNYFF